MDKHDRYWLFEISEDTGIPVITFGRDEPLRTTSDNWPYANRLPYIYYWRRKRRKEETGFVESKLMNIVPKDKILCVQIAASDKVLLANAKVPSSMSRHGVSPRNVYPVTSPCVHQRQLRFTSQRVKTFWTLDHGQRRFKVTFDMCTPYVTIGTGIKTQIVHAFVGLASKNEDNPYFIGNSILLHIAGLKYVFIGRSLYTFTCDSLFDEFCTPVSETDVPYPYGVDKRGRYWLFEISDEIGIPVLSLREEEKYYSMFPVRKPYVYYWRRKHREQVTGLKSKDVVLVQKTIVCPQTAASDDLIPVFACPPRIR